VVHIIASENPIDLAKLQNNAEIRKEKRRINSIYMKKSIFAIFIEKIWHQRGVYLIKP